MYIKMLITGTLGAAALLLSACGGGNYEPSEHPYANAKDANGVTLSAQRLQYIPKENECADDTEVIDTTTGRFCSSATSTDTALRGTSATNDVIVYKGIKYAYSGSEYRWQKAVPAFDFNLSKDVSESFGSECYQSGDDNISKSGVTMSEDCLFLNVWKPLDATTSNKKKVMVFIHGGGFLIGAGSDKSYWGENIVNSQDVIVVTLNYRLGIFGFLDVPDAYRTDGYTGSGNFGLMDQQMAIKWVYDNIEKFGGDKENIIIYGESAGSMSVGFHMINHNATTEDNTSNYFKAGIMESPYMGFPIKPQSLAASMGESTATKLHEHCSYGLLSKKSCIFNDSKLSADTIHKHAQTIMLELMGTDIAKFKFNSIFPFEPYIDNQIVHSNMIDGNITKPLMIGNNADESTLFLLNSVSDSLVKLITATDESYTLFLDGAFSHQELNMTKIIKSVPRYQRVKGDEKATYLQNLINDYAFVCASRNFLGFNDQNNYENANSYLYHFDFISSFNVWGDSSAMSFCDAPMVCHGAELPYVFGAWPDVNFTSEETAMSYNTIIPMWGEFAKSAGESITGFNPYSPSQDNVIEFNNTTPNAYQLNAADAFGNEHNCSLWNAYYKVQPNN